MRLSLPAISSVTNIPFYYIQGNDDRTLTQNGNLYSHLRRNRIYSLMGGRQEFTDNKNGQIVLSKFSYLLEHGDQENNDSGFYVKIEPNLGEFKITHRKETIKIFGISCAYGLFTDIDRTPNTYADIYLSHIPPFGTLDLSARFGVEHIGSKRLLRAVKKYKPRLVICGHSHFWGGNVSQLGETTVLNISSHDNNPCHGNYAIIDTKDWSVNIGSKSYFSLHVMPGMRRILKNNPDPSLETLAHEPCKGTTELRGMINLLEERGINVSTLKPRVESLDWEQPKIIGQITCDPNVETFVDVETGLAEGNEPGCLWLVGLWRQGEIKQFEYPSQTRAFLNI